MIEDIIPRTNIYGNKLREDLKIIDFVLYKFKTYFIPIYILTDSIISFNQNYFETMIRIGFINNCEFLCFEERCISKLEAYHQHKVIYKKILKGFFDKDIDNIIKKRGLCNEI